MYAIYAYIDPPKPPLNVGIYGIHGVFGYMTSIVPNNSLEKRVARSIVCSRKIVQLEPLRPAVWCYIRLYMQEVPGSMTAGLPLPSRLSSTCVMCYLHFA